MATVTSSALIVRPVVATPARIVAHQNHGAEAITVGGLCEQFLYSKQARVAAGDIAPRTVENYERLSLYLVHGLGSETLVSQLSVRDFVFLRAELATRLHTPSSLGPAIQMVRTIFKFGHDSGLYRDPVRFGPDFKRPTAKSYRKAKKDKGSMMLEAEQIRRLLDVADPIVRAQILLGVNCGFGDGDCAKLPITALDLDGGWVDFPRPKTGVDRRCPLWPETVKAIRRAVEVRKPPKRSGLEHLAFLTKFGASWIGYMDKAKMTRYFPTLARKAGVTLKDGQGFYALRRTFETIGGDTGDQVAVDYLMGHAPTSGDMAAVYRQRFEDHRLIAVTEHVRRWLCPDKSQAQIDADSRRRQLAGEINVEWEKIERLAGKDVKTALNKLHISQTDLAKAVGYSLDWVNTKICGRVDRHGKEGISAEADFRFRAYISQLAEGIDPQPLAGEELMPRYEGPHDFPLSDEAVSALKRHPFTAVELRVVVVCLKESGVKQETLAEWWSYSHKFFREMLCRRKSIPYNAANRLRQLFRVPTVEIELGEPRKLVLGRLPITPEVRAALDSTQFGLADATKVLEYLRSIGILKAELCRFLGLHYTRYFSNAGCGRSSLLQPRLRSLFAFGEEGGAQ